MPTLRQSSPSSEPDLLIRCAEIAGRGRPLDVRVAGGRIVELGRELERAAGEPVLDAAGAALLPGLHDHHLHLLALAAADASVRCGPPDVQTRDELARALRAAPGAVIRGIGYHESVAGELERTALDRLGDGRPVRIQHRSGALWIVNGTAIERLGLDRGVDAPGVERDPGGRATGRLWRLDAWLRGRLDAGEPPPPLAPASRRLARFGITGVTDAGAGNSSAELALLTAACERGELLQRVVVMGGADLPEPSHPRLARGARKLLLDERELPPLEELGEAIAAAHSDGRGVAVHCVTSAELVLACAAFERAGPRAGDRIEHAAVTLPGALEQIAGLGLTVVTQPNFVRERGDAYLREVEPRELPFLYRARGLLAAGVPLGGGTDAPFGDPDPWLAMRAAVERRTPGGAVLGPEEALTPEQALALFCSDPREPGGPARRIEPGAAADLCLLDRPWAEARTALASSFVAATLCSGSLVYRA